MKEGWIKLHRSIQDCNIWETSEPFDMRSAWIDLLLMANHSDKIIVFDGKPMLIKRGQFVTSVRKMSVRWRWSKDKVLKYLRLLEKLQMLRRNSNKKRTLLTIENYDYFQGEQDTDKDTNETQTGHRLAINKNVKNEKNKKNNVFRNFPEREIDFKALEEEVT